MQQISGIPPRVIARDLTDPQSPRTVYDELSSTPIDYLVNNAGFGLRGHFSGTDRQTELDMIQVNVTSLVDLTKLFLPAMVARRSGAHHERRVHCGVSAGTPHGHLLRH